MIRANLWAVAVIALGAACHDRLGYPIPRGPVSRYCLSETTRRMTLSGSLDNPPQLLPQGHRRAPLWRSVRPRPVRRIRAPKDEHRRHVPRPVSSQGTSSTNFLHYGQRILMGLTAGLSCVAQPRLLEADVMWPFPSWCCLHRVATTHSVSPGPAAVV